MLTAVSVAREMGFDEDTIADLVAQGLLAADEDAAPWRPANLVDVNWLVGKHAEYEAEAARVQAQCDRRLKAIAHRKAWLSRYADDCREIVDAHLPRKADGTPKRLFLDLEDGRVKLQRKGGGLTVDAQAVIDALTDKYRTPHVVTDDEWPLLDALRVSRVVAHTHGVAVSLLISEPDQWKAEVLKTPLSAYLKAHPEAELPGVTVEPTRYEFAIESLKA